MNRMVFYTFCSRWQNESKRFTRTKRMCILQGVLAENSCAASQARDLVPEDRFRRSIQTTLCTGLRSPPPWVLGVQNAYNLLLSVFFWVFTSQNGIRIRMLALTNASARERLSLKTTRTATATATPQNSRLKQMLNKLEYHERVTKTRSYIYFYFFRSRRRWFRSLWNRRYAYLWSSSVVAADLTQSSTLKFLLTVSMVSTSKSLLLSSAVFFSAKRAQLGDDFS